MTAHKTEQRKVDKITMNNSKQQHSNIDDDDDETLNEIEQEMDTEMNNDELDFLAATMTNTSVSTTAGASHAVTHATLPTHQTHHAAEFWFPECRECTCCRGYKHGCTCGGLCKCSVKSVDVVSTKKETSNQPAVNKKEACKFYQQGSCWFGDLCRFSHDSIH